VEPHAHSAELAYLSVDEISQRLERGELTSVALVESLLTRITALDAPGTATALRSVAHVAADALEVAAALDAQRAAGTVRSALHGVPVLIKDNIEAVGLPGAAGSTALLGRASSDAELVTRLRDAGAIVMGSTNLSEWANIRSPRSTSGWSATDGLVGNPWALDRSAGGSSSGSGAAVAAGFAPLAVGTETDGSITCPASLNGVVGLKPTVGAVSRHGIVPISASQDSPGPMARNVADVAALYGVLSGTSDPGGHDGVRFAYASNWLIGAPATDELVRASVTRISEHHAEVVTREVAVPSDAVEADEFTVLLCELCDDLSSYLAQRPGEGVRSLAEVVAYEAAHATTEMPYFGHEFFELALATGGRGGEQYAPARERNLAWATSECLEPGLEGVDVLLASLYVPAWKSDLVVGGHHGFSSCATTAAAIAGWPIMSVPIGLVHGLPVGVAMIARPHDEWKLLAAARVVESILEPQRENTRPSWRQPQRG
jgi:amidase